MEMDFWVQKRSKSAKILQLQQFNLFARLNEI
jgi:hypothetical protein